MPAVAGNGKNRPPSGSPSALSLWVRQARAERTKGKSGLMKEEREELTGLRKEVRELRLERDLPKKSRPSSPKTSGRVRDGRCGEGLLSRPKALSALRRVCERVLCVTLATGIEACPGRPAA